MTAPLPARLTLLLLIGGASLHAEPARATAPEVASMEAALYFLGRVSDVDFQSRERLQAMDRLLVQGDLARATECARGIRDYRRALALGRVAAALARTDATAAETLLADPAFASAERENPTQAEYVRAEIAIAWAALGQMEKAGGVLGGLRDLGARCRARAGLSLERASRGESYAEYLHEEKPGQIASQKDFFPDRIETVRALLAIARMKLAAGDPARAEVAELAGQAGKIIESYRLIAGDELLELGLLWRQLDRPQESAKAFGDAFRQMPPGVEMNSWNPGSFARLSVVYRDAGRGEDVAKMFSTVRAGVDRQHRFYHPAALCQLAEAQQAVGAAPDAERTWLEALAATRDGQGEVDNYLGCAQVAFSLERCFPKMPEKIAAAFAPLLPAPPSTKSTDPAR